MNYTYNHYLYDSNCVKNGLLQEGVDLKVRIAKKTCLREENYKETIIFSPQIYPISGLNASLLDLLPK